MNEATSTAPQNPSASTPLRAVVLTHGHCFDGLCSAVMFTRLLRAVAPGRPLAVTYHAAGYGPGQGAVDPTLLVGDVNAVLDFRFSTSPKLTWYFDHHVSAFPSTADKAAYESHVGAASAAAARRFFHDGAYSSCTKLIADIGAAHFGVDPAPTAELVRWADVIDSAAFPNARMPVERKEPELQLMTVVEHFGDDAFLTRFVPRLLSEPLSDVARSREVTEAFAPLQAGHDAFVALVKERAVPSRGVVLVDLSDSVIEVAGKFVTYALFPDSAYSVLLSRSNTKCKISVGFNPWSGKERRHNIASICERHGGGGHPVVGAISLPAGDVGRAQALAAEVARELAE
jgi:hypothetical protein